jgi:hypothetical protein
VTEDELFAEILDRCQGRDLWVVRVPTERRTNRIADNLGFPDVVIYGPGGALYRELKTDKVGKRPSPSQTRWKHRLTSGGHNWDIWTPRDLRSGRIDNELNGLATPDEYTDDFSLVMARD